MQMFFQLRKKYLTNSHYQQMPASVPRLRYYCCGAEGIRSRGIGDVFLAEVVFNSLGLLLDAAEGADCGTGEGQIVSRRSGFDEALLQVGVEQFVRIQSRRVAGRIEDRDLVFVVGEPFLHALE